jgi:hypothetical protein
MHNQTKWNIAIIRFAAFCSHMPLAPDEDDISEYHDIIKLFEDAYQHDLSQFRIALEPISEERSNPALTSLQGRWQTRHPSTNVVENRYFRGQVRGLVDFLTTVLASRTC